MYCPASHLGDVAALLKGERRAPSAAFCWSVLNLSEERAGLLTLRNYGLANTFKEVHDDTDESHFWFLPFRVIGRSI